MTLDTPAPAPLPAADHPPVPAPTEAGQAALDAARALGNLVARTRPVASGTGAA